MKTIKPLFNRFSVLTGIFFFSIFNLAWISTGDYDFGNLKNKDYYKDLFGQVDLLKLADADDFYEKGNTKMLDAEKYFRKADGFKKVAENYGGKTLRKVKRYEKKGVKTALKAYEYYFKASNIKFHVYSDKLKNMNTDNSKKHLKAEEIAINARSIYIQGSELKTQADKLKGKNKVDALKLAFDKHLEAIYNQELAFGIYMNDPNILYDENKDKVTDINKKNIPENKTDELVDDNTDNTYTPKNDPNIYESKEDFIIEKLNMSEEDKSVLADAKDKMTYADNIMKDVDKGYSKIDKIRTEAELSEDTYEKDMKNKMAAGLEDVLFEKMLKAADLYFNADKTKYEIYKKYLAKARTSDNITEGKKHENNAAKLHSKALQKYHKANFYSGHKSNKYIQIMDAVQTELSAVQEQENAFSIYFNQADKIVDIPKNNTGKTNDIQSSPELTYNYSGSFTYSKYNPKPVPLKAKKGIIFKVQVGLFKGLLPLKTYGKYSPISYDTFKNNPYRRFFLGEYRSYKAAEYVLNRIKKKGLTDPFIVAYENGVKKSATYGISKIVRDADFEKTETKEMSLLTGGVYKNNNNNTFQAGNNETENSSEIKDISQFNGLVYCIQLGSFSSPKQKSDFPDIHNLISEHNKAAYKYLAGTYSSYEEAKKESQKLNQSYPGTFIVAYNYGKKISLSQASEIKKSGNANSSDKKTTNKNNIYFSVQIAAYSHKLNDAEMQQFSNLSKRYPIKVKQVDGGLFLYTVGKYGTYKDAASVKKDIKAMNYDGFVIAFKNGIKISASEAVEILKHK